MSRLVLGKKAIIEQLNKRNITSVHAIAKFPEIYKKCSECNIEYIIEDKKFFDNIDANHQGIIGYIKKINYITDSYNEFIDNFYNKKQIILILDGLEDAGNVGAIIRTCDCMGIDGIIFKKNNQYQLDNPSIIKNSQGAIYNCNILRVSNLSQVVDNLKQDGFWVLSSSLSSSSIELSKIPSFDKIAIVVGNEEKGVSRNIIDKSDVVVKIPMYGSSQSLNVSAATAILLYSIKHS